MQQPDRRDTTRAGFETHTNILERNTTNRHDWKLAQRVRHSSELIQAVPGCRVITATATQKE